MLLPLIAAVLAVDMVRVAPSVREVTDPHTGIKVQVQVDGFDISRTEITQRDYFAVVGGGSGSDLPVAGVSWFDAIGFANGLSKKDGLEPCYDPQTGMRLKPRCAGYRLPTDAEWSRALEVADNLNINLGLDTVATDPARLLALQPRPAPGGDKLVDMTGNVWEWCEDWFSPISSPWPLHNPRGPLRGLERVIRGGSYQTTRTRWRGELRSSMDPNAKSSRTGIRIVRSRREVADLPVPDWSVYHRVPANPPPPPVMAPSVTREKWEAILGSPKLPRTSPPAVRELRKIEDSWLDARILEYETEPGQWEKFAILDGAPEDRGPKPLIIVPFYDVDTSIGIEFGGRNFASSQVLWYARLAAQKGYLAVAVRWYGESYGERYDEAVANLAARHPGVTGLGKWVWDARRLLDYLVTLPMVDKNRIGMIGHSLGGKMTMYAAAMDERIRASVVSDPGIPLASTNYQDYWYLGDKLKVLPAGSDHHELVKLIAPRSFLLIAGEADDERSWSYLESARPAFPDPNSLGWIHHKTGHRPTPESISQALAWLWERLR